MVSAMSMLPFAPLCISRFTKLSDRLWLRVTKEDDVKALVEKFHAEVGQIDILVNNAGIIKRIPMHEMKRAEFQAVIDVDLVAPYIVSSAVQPCR